MRASCCVNVAAMRCGVWREVQCCSAQALLAASEGPQGAAALLTLSTLARQVAAQLAHSDVAESRASSGGAELRWDAAQAALVSPGNPLAPFACIRPLLQASDRPRT